MALPQSLEQRTDAQRQSDDRGIRPRARRAPQGSVTQVVEEVRPAAVKVDASGQAAGRGPFGFGGPNRTPGRERASFSTARTRAVYTQGLSRG